MTKGEILNWLEGNKDARGIKHWEKAGNENWTSYGIGMTKLKSIAKKIGKDHELAIELWDLKNFECKVLSTLVEIPRLVTRSQIEQQLKDVGFWMLSHAYCNYLLKLHPDLQSLSEEWIESPNHLKRRCGYQLLYQLAQNKKSLPDSYFYPYIETIHAKILNEENFVKDAMNNALWGIGMRTKALNEKCIIVAGDIGVVDVDYGDNSCKAIRVEEHLKSERVQKKIQSSG